MDRSRWRSNSISSRHAAARDAAYNKAAAEPARRADRPRRSGRSCRWWVVAVAINYLPPRHASSTPGPPPPRPAPGANSTAAPGQTGRASGPRINGASASFPEVILRRFGADSRAPRPEAPPGRVFLQPGLCLIGFERSAPPARDLPAGFVGRLWSTRPVGLQGLPLHFRAATVALVRYNTAATATSLYLLDWIHRCLSPVRSRPNSGNFVWWYICPAKSRPRF